MMEPSVKPAGRVRGEMSTPEMPPEKRAAILDKLGEVIAGKRAEAIKGRQSSGVYAITNQRNGKRYIGSAIDIQTRFAYHRWELKRGDHHSVKLQRAWNKYGSEAFTFDVLLICSSDMRLFYEQKLLDGLNAVCEGYNVLGNARSSAGRKLSDETKALLSRIHTGKVMSLESREKMRQRMLGRSQPEHVRAKISATLMGRKKSPETLAKLTGLTHSQDVRNRIAATLKGHAVSAETCAKITATKAARKAARQAQVTA